MGGRVVAVTLVPHLALPFSIGAGGRARTVEQDTLDDIAQCVQVLLTTVVGERVELPEYGIDDPTFLTRMDLNEIRLAIEEWEPRAETLLFEEPDRFDELVRYIIAETSKRGVD